MSSRVGRNDPCPCGSGRKWKRCCSAKKPRQVATIIDFGTTTRLDAIGITHDNRIECFRDGRLVDYERSWVEVGYERPKGAKVLTRVPISDRALVLAANAALLGYEALFAIDTNTRRVSSNVVSIAALVHAQLTSVADGRADLQYRVLEALEMHNITDFPERVGWWIGIDRIMARPDYRAGMRLGIIVDAHLDQLAELNDRQSPICLGSYLPHGMDLIYASADAGKEQIPNVLISTADEAARKVFAVLASSGSKALNSAAPGMPFTHFRRWENEGN